MGILLGLASLCFLGVMIAAVTAALGTVGFAVIVFVITCLAGALLLPVILPALGAAEYIDAKDNKEWAQEIRESLKIGVSAVLTLAMCALPIAVAVHFCLDAWRDGLIAGIFVTLFCLGCCSTLIGKIYGFWWRTITKLSKN